MAVTRHGGTALVLRWKAARKHHSPPVLVVPYLEIVSRETFALAGTSS